MFTVLTVSVLYSFLTQRLFLLLFFSKQDALEILKDYGRNLITPGAVARVLGMMAQTHTGLPESVPYLVSRLRRVLGRAFVAL